MFTTKEELLDYLKKENVEYVDIRFCDLPGTMQHFSIPASAFDESVFEDGLAFDGSSIRGFQSIDESDMMLLPDVTTARIDPFRAAKTLNVSFFVHDPFTREAYSRDPRNIARKAEEYLVSTGIADTCFFGAEAEFYIFDSVSYDSSINGSFYEVDSISGSWNTGRALEEDGSPNLGYKVRGKGGYFPVAPYDHYVDLRDKISTNLQNAGFTLERGHHEVGTGGQAEINYKFDTLLHAADDVQLFKYIVKNTAWQEGKTVTFMPKPLFGDNGSGMHAHQSLWKDGKPLFYDEAGYGGLSDIARYYIGGILHHAPSLLAFTNPTINSYKRLVPGYEAPINLVYSQRNRSACVRIPITGNNPKAKRIEFRCPDSSGNPYLAFAAMMMAGLDGIKNKIEPHAPVDKDLYELPPEEAKGIPQAPTSLPAVIDRLEEDHEYLTAGGVFTEDLIEEWVSYKRENEIEPVNLRPHPYEFQLYYDV
ncbi:Glutamine synthetase OS=Tsukamurella paurometabola (strain ATCC 8368 / DSM / CCUG 35730 / CIP 100753 / JCM 10117 / KCTC 9821 / NBRC 16120 / NCIMB 702349/ NCTC 13040) OX=521096 GN=Tpau_1510 PE=3 SV=1 [Tsukamurella paurometabola]|uniref:Glutamine synthetase n=1 Tax=Tsukamurella paurometabola (strain ATCC 8368 / DSM 20162 / CCUG 35730 / CIP 100753 / JCM 10117 / KCTC 9821 / NBRC 16120 / NCIMB 702349 / NCTC 13040) TaxID=521096 RepID=D5UXP2_TSUPD|nr:type I glutamate--ammonia ligase [Tsukamurella paurometabola]ADG78134.1 glutamine synthetase, type I [Tsukamurella paurometabola DSM 20162]SUP30343.1 Glutamine synthetase 1 [Tsukamurella paurometabola]